MSILRICCSPQGLASESYRLSERIIQRLQANQPGGKLDVIDVDATRLPHADSDYAAALSSPADPLDGQLELGTLKESARQIQLLTDASHLVLSTPMHNFTVPSSLKVWLDHVVRVRSTFRITAEGKRGLLANRPVYVAISSGGGFSGDNAGQPDFLTPYLRHVLATIGLHQITFISVEGTARGPEFLEAARKRADAAIAALSFSAAQPAIAV